MDAKEVIIGNKTVKQIRLNGETVYNSIVRQYEELEYIEFDGVAEIDLQLDHVSGYEYEAMFNLPSQSAAWAPIFTTQVIRENTPVVSLYLNQNTTCFLALYERRCDFGLYFSDFRIVLGETISAKLTPNTLTLNGAEFPVSTEYRGQIVQGVMLGAAIVQHFMFRVKDADGNVVCDCRPARRLSDGECGMFDRARGLFLTRTSERGEVTGNYPTGRLY